MSYYFYVLKSEKTGRLYKGHAKDPSTRLKEHNAGRTKSIKAFVPWELIHLEEFSTREEAVKREKEAKTVLGGRELKKTLKDKGQL